jgi:hypothetical protein
MKVVMARIVIGVEATGCFGEGCVGPPTLLLGSLVGGCDFAQIALFVLVGFVASMCGERGERTAWWLAIGWSGAASL